MSDVRLFKHMTSSEQIKHIRKCQKNAVECIRHGEASDLADIADHVDIWGPWLCDELEKTIAERDKLAEINKVLVEALEFECGDRCAHQNPCNAREALDKIKEIEE